MEIIELNQTEFEFASYIGLQRCSHNLFANFAPAYGADKIKGLFDFNCIGCCSELAVAKYLNCFWPTKQHDLLVPDVGGVVEVRSTPYADGFLRMHDKDNNQAPYVLALTYDLPKIYLVGWVLGSAGKDQKYWGDKWGNNRPAFWVPQGDLLPMSELKVRYDAWRNKKGA